MYGWITFPKFSTPMDSEFNHELDESPLCDANGISKYRSLIGSANWCIILGCFNINYAVITFTCYLCAPQEGHVTAMHRVFGYLKSMISGKMLINVAELPI